MNEYLTCRDCKVQLTEDNRGFCFPFQCEDCEEKYWDSHDKQLDNKMVITELHFPNAKAVEIINNGTTLLQAALVDGKLKLLKPIVIMPGTLEYIVQS